MKVVEPLSQNLRIFWRFLMLSHEQPNDLLFGGRSGFLLLRCRHGASLQPPAPDAAAEAGESGEIIERARRLGEYVLMAR